GVTCVRAGIRIYRGELDGLEEGPRMPWDASPVADGSGQAHAGGLSAALILGMLGGDEDASPARTLWAFSEAGERHPRHANCFHSLMCALGAHRGAIPGVFHH